VLAYRAVNSAAVPDDLRQKGILRRTLRQIAQAGLSKLAGANVPQSSLTGSHRKLFLLVEDAARR
jgi:hypothetical protein